ncbi:tetratricopeptide repeat protein [Candidatus Bathyarchaeota archaeon]|nr:MAG: tetratricopeptide repeat protein [Candidatus Bathyarchaeota archaeon]
MPLEMSGEKARHMLELSRALRWEFPSSQGTPIIRGQAASRDVEQATKERESYANAARVLSENGNDEGAFEIAANAWRLWIVARDIHGGRAFLASVLDKGEKKPSRARSLALYGDALLAFRQGKIEESRQSSQAALDVALEVNDREGLTLAYLALSRIAFEDGDYAKSATLAVKARKFARGLDPAMGQAPLFLHASATRLTGDYDHAAALFEQSLELNRKIQDQGMVAAELQNLGFVEIHRGNVDKAERYFTEGEKMAPASDPYSTAMSIINKAVIAFLRGNLDESRSLLQRAQSVFKEAGIDPGADDQFEINWLHGQLTTKKAR